MSFSSKSIEVKRLFTAHPEEDRTVLDGIKVYAKQQTPDKKELDCAPVKLSDESLVNLPNASMTDITMLKSDVRAFSYEQIRVEGSRAPAPELLPKRQAISFQFSLSVPTNLIIKHFLDVANSREFHIILLEKKEIVVGKHHEGFFSGLCKGLLQCRVPTRSLTSIKMRIRIDTTFCKREIDLIAIKGSKALIEGFFNECKHKLLSIQDFKEIKGSRVISKKLSSHEFIEAEMLDTNKTINNFFDEHYDLRSSDKQENFWLNSLMQGSFESSSYYYFHKILAVPNYIIGKKTQAFIENFLALYKQPMKLSGDPLPRAGFWEKTYFICEFLNEVIESLFSEYNYGKKETKELMPYCRKSIEKYIFERLYATVSALYQQKYAKEDLKLKENMNKILQLPFIEFLSSLKISAQYFEEELAEHSQTLLLDLPAEKYQTAIFELGKIPNFKTPYEKLSTILMVHILLKSQGPESPYLKKSQTEIKDTEIKENKACLFVFLIAKSSTKYLKSELALIEDYISFFVKCEHEKKIVRYLKEALDMIYNFKSGGD